MCETHRKKTELPQCSCVSREQFIAIGICAIFSREQFLFQHFMKKKRDILVFRTVLLSQKPISRFVSLKTN